MQKKLYLCSQICQNGINNIYGTGFDRDEMSRSQSELNDEMMDLLKNTNIMSKIQPLADRVLVKAAAAEEKTVGGIIIPDNAKEKPIRGEVVAVGTGTKDEPMHVQPGDQILFGKWAGSDFEFDGEKYLMMKQSDIWAVIK